MSVYEDMVFGIWRDDFRTGTVQAYALAKPD